MFSLPVDHPQCITTLEKLGTDVIAGKIPGATFMMIRRDDNALPPWECCLDCKFWLLDEFAKIRSSLKVRPTSMEEGEHEAVQVKVMKLKDENGNVEKEIVYGTPDTVIHFRDIDYYVVEINIGTKLPDEIITALLSDETPPFIIRGELECLSDLQANTLGGRSDTTVISTCEVTTAIHRFGVPDDRYKGVINGLMLGGHPLSEPVWPWILNYDVPDYEKYVYCWLLGEILPKKPVRPRIRFSQCSIYPSHIIS